MKIAIWNHDLVNDRTVMTADTARCIGAGSFHEYEEPLATEILTEAKRTRVPFSTELPARINVAGTSAVPAVHHAQSVASMAAATSLLGVVIPMEIFDRENLIRLDKDILLKIAECVGAIPLLSDATPKRVIVDEIEEALGRGRELRAEGRGPAEEPDSKKKTQPISISENLPAAAVSPTVNGRETSNAAGAEEQEP